MASVDDFSHMLPSLHGASARAEAAGRRALSPTDLGPGDCCVTVPGPLAPWRPGHRSLCQHFPAIRPIPGETSPSASFPSHHPSHSHIIINPNHVTGRRVEPALPSPHCHGIAGTASMSGASGAYLPAAFRQIRKPEKLVSHFRALRSQHHQHRSVPVQTGWQSVSRARQRGFLSLEVHGGLDIDS